MTARRGLAPAGAARRTSGPAGRRLTLHLSQAQIQEAVGRLASQLRRDYKGKRPLLVGVLVGSFVFMADLVRRLDMPLEVDFVRVASYGASTISSGRPRILSGPRLPVVGRHVLVVEDIVDTGLTTEAVLCYLRRRRPASLRLCALLDKPARRRAPVKIDYCGITVPDRFLVGYGLDLAQDYRQLPDVHMVEEGSDGSQGANSGRQG